MKAKKGRPFFMTFTKNLIYFVLAAVFLMPGHVYAGGEPTPASAAIDEALAPNKKALTHINKDVNLPAEKLPPEATAEAVRPSTVDPLPKNTVAGEWIDFSQNSEKLLRGYSSEAFPPPGWSKNASCFALDSPSGFGSDLMTRGVFEEFELEFDWKYAKGGNSGVLFAVQPGEEYSYLSGPEIQLLDDAHNSDGKKAITSLGALYDLSEPIAAAKSKLEMREPNACRLVVTKDSVKFYVNGVLITDASLDPKVVNERIAHSKFKEFENFYKKREGHILFQDHGGKTEFCNVRVRKLTTK